MSAPIFHFRRAAVAGVLVTSCVALFLWWHPSSENRGPSQPTNAGKPAQHEVGQPHEVTATKEDPGGPLPHAVSVKPPATAGKAAVSAPLSRETNITANPYAAGLRGPGKSKRAWDAAYIDSFREAKTDDPVSFELTQGVMAHGSVKIVQSQNGAVTYVSGELTAPEAGKFFILKPPAGGKAGAAVAVVEFPGSKTAYRVEPTGPDGAPELWQRQLNEVICEEMAEADPALLQAAEAVANGTENTGNAVPLRPDAVADYIPSYNANIVSLQSYPGSPAVLLLDFAGGHTDSWGGVTYSRAPVGNDVIRDIWKRVAEDFMPFNINVTTDIKVFQAAPAASRQRCCFGPNPVTGVGVAYFGSWNWGNDTVCWSGYYTGKAGAEVGAHEPGHTLGLAHQGQDIPDGSGGTTHNEYYTGQGSGETGWAPIMGAGYYQPLTTWAKGEFQYGSQPQDELLTIVTSNNNVHYRTDDTGDTLATSRYLDVNADNSVSAEGVIEQTGDTDAFQFTTTGGAVTLTAKSVAPNDWADLAMMATLASAADTVIATANVQSSTSATITSTLAAGTYTFRVTGAGKNDPVTNGFSNYASLGYYSIGGNVAGARQPTRLSVAEHSANNTAVGTVTANNPNASPLVYTITSGNTGNTFSVDSNGVVRVADNTLLDYYALAANPALYAARFELLVNITNTNNPSYTETARRVLIDVRKFYPPVPAYVTAVVDTGLRIKLSWGGGSEATSYNIKRATTPGGPYTTVGTTTNFTYSDAGLTHGTTYYYVVSSVNANGESANSAEASTSAQAVAGFSFESPSVGGYSYYPSGAIWTFSGSAGDGSGILANGSGFGNPNAPDGTQAAFIQGYGTITQTLSGFIPGTNYIITYSAAQRSGSAQHGGESWNVVLDGNVIQTNSPGGTGYAAYTATFTASSTYHTLSFVGTDLAGGDNTVFIDNVRISIVPPTLANFSFETPNLGTGSGSYQYSPTGASWTFSTHTGNNGAGIVGNGSAFSNTNAAQGTQAGFVQSIASISQTVSGFIPGGIYTLNFAAAQRSGGNQHGGQSWDVKVNNAVIQSYGPGGTAYANYAATFTASAASQTLAFAGTDLAGGDNTVFIDNITLVSPPLPTAASVVLTNPANNASFLNTASINLAANVAANGNLVNGVEFYADNITLLGSATTAPYSFAWTNAGAGWHNVYARVLFNNGSYADSPSVRISIINSNPDLGFETPGLGNGNHQYNPAGGSWTFDNSTGIVANGSAFGNPNAPAGTQAAFVQSYGRFSQTLSGFIPGNIYTITCSAAQRPGSVQHGGESWDVTIDDNIIQSNSPGTTSYTTCTATFTATSTIHTLGFVGTDLAGGDNTVFIDNVIIDATPPPSGLAATAGNAQISLTWGASGGATGYNVKRATVSGGPYTTIANVTTTGYVDTGLTNGTDYYYVVTALKNGAETGVSSQAGAAPLNVLPSIPAGLTATAANSQVSLSWTASSYATSYNVKRATVSGGPYTTVGNVATTGFTNTGLTNGTIYYYVVSALNAGGESNNSGQTSATPFVSIPGGGFENPAIGGGNYRYNPTGGVWTFNGASPNGSGIVANGSGFSNPNAPEGTQAAFVQEFGTVTQVIAGFVTGSVYRVKFKAAERPGNAQSWNVKIDSTVIGSYNPGSGASSYTDYTTSTFTATAATHTLAFVGTDLAGGDNTIFIDNVVIELIPPPPAPTNLVATAGNAQVGLSWTASSGATGYNVKRSAVSGGPYTTVGNVSTTSFNNTGLSNGTTYYYVVTALAAGGESAISSQTSAVPQVPAPGAPTNLVATAGNAQVGLSWTASSGATTYNVKRSAVNGGPYTTVGNVSTTSFTNTGLTNGTTCYYVVTALNAGGESGNSSQASAQPQVPAPSAPTGLAATAGNAQAGLSWTASSGATTYNVKRSAVSGGPYTTVGNVSTTSFTNTGLTNGNTYYYVVTALNAGGESGNSSQASAQPQVPAPSAPTSLVSTAGNAQVDLIWTASSGATTYNVKRSAVNGGPYTTVGNVSTTSFTNTGLTNGTACYYVVTALNAGGESGISSQTSATPQVPAPDAPTGLIATAGDTQVGLTWTASPGATSYNIKCSTVSGGPYVPAGNVTTTSFTNTGLTNGSVYFYVVTAENAGGESGISNQTSATPQVPAPETPTGLAATAGDSQVGLTWAESPGATSYNVKSSTVSGGPYITMGNVTTTSFTDTSLTNGTASYYVVSAVNAGGESGNSGEAGATPLSGNASGTSTPLVLKSHSFDFTARLLHLTFASDANTMYKVTWSADLVDWSTIAADNIAGEAGQTTISVGITQAPNGFFRVEKK